MKQLKKSVGTTALLLGLFLCGCLLNVLPAGDDVFLLRNMSSFYYLFLGVIAVVYFLSRIIDKRQRRYLVGIGVMTVLLFFFRIEKYAAFSGNDVISRYLWYLYYVPGLLMPQLSLDIALSLNRTEKEKMPTWNIVTVIITLLLMVTVLTNDLHQFVFGFYKGFEYSLHDYTHRVGYWMVVAWDLIMFIASLAVLAKKSKLPYVKKYIWLPVVYVAFFALWGLVTILNLRPLIFGSYFGEIPETICFMMCGLWVLCISIGLIPSNTGYGKILSQTALPIVITDLNRNVIYRSRFAPEINDKQFYTTNPISADSNSLILRKRISGGYVFRQVDITELNKINSELEETQNALAEEEELILLGNELKKKQAQLDAKSELYDSIALRVLPQSHAIEELTACINSDYKTYNTCMSKMCIYGAYIKRMSNFMIYASSGELLSRRDLQLAVGESMRYIAKAGIPAFVSADDEDFSIEAEHLIEVYELFEGYTEKALVSLKGINAVFSGNVLKLTLEGVSLKEERGGFVTVENDDNTAFIRINIKKGGDEH